MPVHVRQARPADPLGPLLYQASPTLYERYFGSRRRALSELSRIAGLPGHAASFEVALVATSGGALAGLLAGYPVIAEARLTRRFFALTLTRMAPWRWPAALRFLHALGTAQLEPPLGAWYVDALAVAPARRRRGVASALLAEAQDRARAAGCTSLALDAELGNAAARRLYESFAMREAATVLADERVGAAGGGWVGYVKAL